MNQSSVVAAIKRVIDNPRGVEPWMAFFLEVVDRGIVIWSIGMSGSTEPLDGYARLTAARTGARLPAHQPKAKPLPNHN